MDNELIKRSDIKTEKAFILVNGQVAARFKYAPAKVKAAFRSKLVGLNKAEYFARLEAGETPMDIVEEMAR